MARLTHVGKQEIQDPLCFLYLFTRRVNLILKGKKFDYCKNPRPTTLPSATPSFTSRRVDYLTRRHFRKAARKIDVAKTALSKHCGLISDPGLAPRHIRIFERTHHPTLLAYLHVQLPSCSPTHQLTRFKTCFKTCFMWRVQKRVIRLMIYFMTYFMIYFMIYFIVCFEYAS